MPLSAVPTTHPFRGEFHITNNLSESLHLLETHPDFLGDHPVDSHMVSPEVHLATLVVKAHHHQATQPARTTVDHVVREEVAAAEVGETATTAVDPAILPAIHAEAAAVVDARTLRDILQQPSQFRNSQLRTNSDSGDAKSYMKSTKYFTALTILDFIGSKKQKTCASQMLN